MTLQNTKTLKKQIAPFEKSSTKESIWQIINTVVPFMHLMVPCLYKPVCFLLVSTRSHCDRCRVFDQNFHYLS